MGQPLMAYVAPSSVRVYRSMPDLSRFTVDDLPLAGGPMSSRMRLRTSRPLEAALKNCTSRSRARSMPNIWPANSLYWGTPSSPGETPAH